MRDWQAFVESQLKLPDLAPERESRIVRELAAQLEDFYREALARGCGADEADAYARAQIRDWDRMAQDVWLADRKHARSRLERLADRFESPQSARWNVMADLLRDVRYGVRQLLRTPGFTTVAILTLAVGIGATAAIFSVVNGVLLRPLPFPDAERLVRVHEVVPQYGRFSVAPATFLDWRQQNTVFEWIAAVSPGTDTIAGSEGPERVQTAAMTWDAFELLKVAPILGRTFGRDEDAPGRPPVIVLSYGAWQRRFGGDPNVLGRSIALASGPATIVGVMPPGFYFPSRDAEFWTPLGLNPANATRGGHFLVVVARLRAGVSVESAGVEIRGISERLARQYPASANESAEVVGLHDQIVGRIRPALLTLFAAVGVVVLIACGNVANLLLVRASAREREMAIRAALGAARRRLALQMLTESLVLAIAGGTLGLLLTYLAIPSIQQLSAGGIPRVQDVAVDRTVLGFVLLVSLLTGLVFGLAPAWQASRTSVGEILKDGGRSSGTVRRRLLRNSLLVAQVALSLVLLVGAALLLRSFGRLTSVHPGFDARNVLTFRMSLPRPSYPQPRNQTAFFTTLLERLEGHPQIASAGMVQTLPLRGSYMLSFQIQGRPPAKPGEVPSANYRSVAPHYFETLAIPVLRGRSFTTRDSDKAPPVAIVDEAFVSRFFAGEDPIGRRIDIGNGTDVFYEIVGIAGNLRQDGLDAKPEPTVYVPFAQDTFSTMWLVVRTTVDPKLLPGTIRQLVRESDPALPVYSISPLADVVSESVAQRRFSMLLITIFAAIALFLAGVGLYGVVSYAVSQRTQEIGVRLAVGAAGTHVLGLIVGGGMKLALLGIAIGFAAALALVRALASMLFEITPFDPASYAATALMLLAVAAVACYVPARRAMRVDPIVALRQE